MYGALLFLAVAAALPPPTGPFPIGRVTVEWVDRSRIEPLSDDRGGRKLMVDVWYPAETSGRPLAPYLDVAAFERAIGAAGLRRQLQGAYDVIKADGVQTHAVAGAPFSRSVLPLLGAQTDDDAMARAHVVAVVRALTLAFFDSTLRGKRPAMLVKTPAEPLIEEISRFGTAQ